MSVAVMSSQLLCNCVKDAVAKAGASKQQQLAAVDRVPRQFQAKLASLQDHPWAMSTGADAK